MDSAPRQVGTNVEIGEGDFEAARDAPGTEERRTRHLDGAENLVQAEFLSRAGA